VYTQDLYVSFWVLLLVESIVLAALIRHARKTASANLVYPIYYLFLTAISVLILARASFLAFFGVTSYMWGLFDIVLLNGAMSALREGTAVFLASRSAGRTTLTRTAAFATVYGISHSAMGASFLSAFGHDGDRIECLHAPCLYWKIYDGSSLIVHLLCLYNATRRDNERGRKARTWRFSAFFASVYTLFFVSVNLESYRTKGSINSHSAAVWGVCGELVAQLLYYAAWPIIAYVVLRADSNYWRSFGVRSPMAQETSHLIVAQEPGSSTGVDADLVIDFTRVRMSDVIGEGATSVVFSGFLDGATPVAVKRFHPQDITASVIKTYVREVSVSAHLRHPNILGTLGVLVELPNLSIVLELCQKGSLFSILHRAVKQHGTSPGDFMSPVTRISYATDVAAAIAFLHSQTPVILHLDIKSLNILVNSTDTAKLSDFGEARTIQSHPTIESASFVTKTPGRGTPNWQAPEVIRSADAYSTAADVYSFGMVLFELITGQPPFAKVEAWKIGFMVAEMGKRPELPSDSGLLGTLAESCWHPDAEERPSAEDLEAELRQELQRLRSVKG
jgi:hypothetical protein